MQAQPERHGLGLFWLVLAALVALVLLAVLPRQLPSLKDVRYRPHAMQRHGQDALEARGCVKNCSADRLRVKLCPPSERHGLSVVFWCEIPAATCPGTVVTIGGVERSSYFRPCADWATCR